MSIFSGEIFDQKSFGNGMAHRMYGDGLFPNGIVEVTDPNLVQYGIGPGGARPIGFTAPQISNIIFDVKKWKVRSDYFQDFNFNNIPRPMASGMGFPTGQSFLFATPSPPIFFTGASATGVNSYLRSSIFRNESFLISDTEIYKYQNKYYPAISCVGGRCPNTSTSLSITLAGIVNNVPEFYNGDPNGAYTCSFDSEVGGARYWTTEFVEGKQISSDLDTVFKIDIFCRNGLYEISVGMYLDNTSVGQLLAVVYFKQEVVSGTATANSFTSGTFPYGGGTALITHVPDTGVVTLQTGLYGNIEIGKFNIMGAECPQYGNLQVGIKITADKEAPGGGYWDSSAT